MIFNLRPRIKVNSIINLKNKANKLNNNSQLFYMIVLKLTSRIIFVNHVNKLF